MFCFFSYFFFSLTFNNSSNNVNAKPLVNKSNLFNGNGNSTPNINNNSIGVVNHGKPNYAPRPPPLQVGGRPNIARHHSMKSPRYFVFIFVIFLVVFSLKCYSINVYLYYLGHLL